MDLSIIIVNWNTRELLAQCLASLPGATAGLISEVIVVDNGSTDGSPALVAERFPSVRLLTNAENLGFVRANNQALPLARGRYVLLLNSDTVAPPESLTRMVQFMDEHPEVGAAGPKLLNPDGTFQGSYAYFPTLGSVALSAAGLARRLYLPYDPSPAPRPDEVSHPVDWVPGACLLIRQATLATVGLLDEGFWMYSEDTDLCYRIHCAGWEVYYLPDVEIVHFGGASSRQCRPESVGRLYRSKLRFFRKHYGFLSTLLLSGVIAAAYGVKAGIAVLTLPLPARRTAARTQFQTAWRVWEGCLQIIMGHKQARLKADTF